MGVKDFHIKQGVSLCVFSGERLSAPAHMFHFLERLHLFSLFNFLGLSEYSDFWVSEFWLITIMVVLDYGVCRLGYYYIPLELPLTKFDFRTRT